MTDFDPFREAEKKADRKVTASQNDRLTSESITRTIMSTPSGRRYTWLRLQKANVFSSTIVLTGEAAFAATAFLEGKRAVGLALLNETMQITPSEFVQMLKENSSAKIEDLETDD